MIEIWHGDCIEVLRELADNSVDAVVTDPPYGLEFMGKDWDTFGAGKTSQPGIGARETEWVSNRGWNEKRCQNCGHLSHGGSPCVCATPSFAIADNRWPMFQRWCEQWAIECLRVLKPGGHLLAFGGTRTWHRMACAIEDAGFEIRDSIAWLYGSGFPKSLDVSKALDKRAGVAREDKFGGAIGREIGPTGNKKCDVCGKWLVSGTPCQCPRPQDLPQSPEAIKWQGWGTALKPAHEPIVVARKPLIGTVVVNVLAHGVGGMNIDATRVGWGTEGDQSASRKAAGYTDAAKKAMGTVVASESTTGFSGEVVGTDASAGRWPANVLLTHTSECVQVGFSKVKGITGGTGNHDGTVYGARTNAGQPVRDYADEDGTETVPAWECEPGCPVAELDAQSGIRPSGSRVSGAEPSNTGSTGIYGTYGRVPFVAHTDSGGASRFFPVFKYQAKAASKERPKVDGVNHPTVKPLELMRWLVKLVTPAGGVVLDPFAGSGTTIEAALLEGFNVIGIEREADYLPLIQERVNRNEGSTVPLVIKRTGLEQYAPGGKARVRLLVIGGPGVGKTRWASYFPDPIYADCEQSLASIADRDMPNVTINSSNDMLALLAELKIECSRPDDQRKYRTVVIDTLDGFQRKLKDEWIQRNPSIGTFTGFDAWNYIDAKIQMLLTRLLNLDMNVVVNVHFSTKRGEADGPKEYGLQLDGSIKDKVFNDFDLVGWLETEWVAENGVRVEKRNITFTRTPQREFLKDRLYISPPGQKGFPINFEERDYEQLFDKIVERMAALRPSEDVGEIPDYVDPSAVPTGAVVSPQDAGSGALPAQDPRTAPLEQFDKPTLLKMAREEGVEGIKANWIKADLVDALKAKRAGNTLLTAVGVEVPPDVVEPETSASRDETPAVPSRVVDVTPTGVVVDIKTGEVIDTLDLSQDEAIANIQNGLGGEVIFDDKPADVPTAPPAPVASVFQFPESCADCGGPLKDEPQNILRISFIKHGAYLCNEDYTYRKTSGGKPKERVNS